MDKALELAIEKAGGQVAVASELGISAQAVGQWKRCPATRALQLERLTNGLVHRGLLRPDLYPDHAPIPVPTEDPSTRRAG